MNKSIKKFLITVSAVGALLFPALTPSLVGAATDVAGNLCNGTQLVATGGAPCTDAGSNNTIQSVVDLIVNLLSLVVGLLSVIFLIFGAFKYITSGGDSGKVTSAKSTILYALIGLVIVAIAQVIVRVVVGKASTIV